MPKSLFKSRKLVYSVATLLAAVVIAILPSLPVEWNPETLDMFRTILPVVFVVGLGLIGGHTLTDVVSLAKGTQKIGAAEDIQKLITESVSNVLNQLLAPEEEPKG